MSIDEQKIMDRVLGVLKEGEQRRQSIENGKIVYSNYKTGSLFHALDIYGWVREDLRIALMKSNTTYALNQEAFGQGLDNLYGIDKGKPGADHTAIVTTNKDAKGNVRVHNIEVKDEKPNKR